MTLRSGARRYPLAWQKTVGALMDAGAEVKAYCTRCDVARPADLGAIAEKFGRSYSLWDRRPPCKVQGCTGIIMFRASLNKAPSVALVS